jgi:hypothetical protein
MATQSNPPEQSYSVSPQTSQQSSRIVPGHTVRKMRELLIYEQELDHVGLLNSLASGFFSAASGCFLFVIGLVTNAVMQDKLSEKGVALLQFGIPLGIVLGVGFTMAGGWSWVTKRTMISELKKQAIGIDQPIQSPMPPAARGVIPSISDTSGRQP